MTGQAIDHESRTFWEKALEFTRAGASLLAEGVVSEETYKKRLASCHACEKIDRAPDGQEYCGGCDCGRWPLSRLDRKLYFPELTCPLGRAGFANEGRPTDPRAWKTCEGCSKPGPDRSPFHVGERVVIAVYLPGESPDLGVWRVEARREDVYDIARRRSFFSWAFWRNLGRRERASVHRDALARASQVRGAR